jgi:hypothetical protein
MPYFDNTQVYAYLVQFYLSNLLLSNRKAESFRMMDVVGGDAACLAVNLTSAAAICS